VLYLFLRVTAPVRAQRLTMTANTTANMETISFAHHLAISPLFLFCIAVCWYKHDAEVGPLTVALSRGVARPWAHFVDRTTPQVRFGFHFTII